MSPLRHALIALALATGGFHPRLAPAAEPPLPEGAKLRLGPTKFRHPYAGRMAALTPDGKAVIAFQYPERLRYLSVETGDEVKVVKVADDRRGGGWAGLQRTADGKRLLLTQYNAVQVLDAETGAVVFNVPVKEDNPRLGVLGGSLEGMVGASGDGSRIAVGTRYQRNNEGATAAVLDAATGAVVTVVKPGQSAYVRPVLSPDGKLLATFGQFYPQKPTDENWATIVQVWDATTGAEKFRAKTGVPYQVQAAAFSPDGKLLVTAAPGAPVQGWDTATGRAVRQYVSRAGIGQGLFFSPDGSKLAGTAIDGTVQVWEAATGKRLGIGGAPVYGVTDVVFPPGGGPAVALGTANQAMQVWTVPGTVLTPQDGHLGGVTALQFTPDGKHLVSAGQDHRVIRWDPATGAELARLGRGAGDTRQWAGSWSLYHAAITPDARTVVVPNGGTGIAAVDLETGAEQFSLYLPGARSGSMDSRLSVSADGRRVAGSCRYYDHGKNGLVAGAWDLETGQLLAEWRAEQDANSGWMESAGVTLTADGSRLAVATMKRDRQGGQSLELAAIDLATGATTATASYPGGPYTPGLAAAADGRSVLVPGHETKVGVWDLPSGKMVRTLDVAATNSQQNLYRFSPDGRLVATVVSEPGRPGTDRGAYKLKVLEWATGTPRFDWEVPGTVLSAAFSPDGRTLAAGGSDTTILLYDLTGAGQPRPWEKSPTDPGKLWAQLATGPAAAGWAAIRELAARPDVAVPLVREKVKPAAARRRPAPAEVAKLIAALDAPAFADREAAGRALREHGAVVEAEVRAALRQTASSEARQRLGKIVEALDKPVPVNAADVRAVEVLERIGSGPAREYLAALATGEPTAPLTRDAAAALKRLDRR